MWLAEAALLSPVCFENVDVAFLDPLAPLPTLTWPVACDMDRFPWRADWGDAAHLPFPQSILGCDCGALLGELWILDLPWRDHHHARILAGSCLGRAQNLLQALDACVGTPTEGQMPRWAYEVLDLILGYAAGL